MDRRVLSTRLRCAFSLALGALVVLGATPLRAETADPGRLPPQPGTPAPDCGLKLGATNSWDALGSPVLVDGTDNDNAEYNQDTWAYRSSVDPERPCLVYRMAGDARSVERSADGGTTYRPVFFDGRTASNGTAMRISGVYTPKHNVVYLSEDGNGTAVVRSLDGGATWQPANGGLQGQPVRRLTFAPSDTKVAYAVAEKGGVPLTGGSGRALTVFATRDGGDTWRQLPLGQLTQAQAGRFGYSVAVDPKLPGHVIISVEGVGSLYGTTVGGAEPAPGSVLFESRDYGETFTPQRVDADVSQVLFARRAADALRLYLVIQGNVNGSLHGIRYSDDEAGHWSQWTQVRVDGKVKWFGGIIDPTRPDKILYFGKPSFERASTLLALYTRDGFVQQELGEQPAVTSPTYTIGQFRADNFGQFYIDIGVDCRREACPPGAKTGAVRSNAWTTFRFRPPDPGQAFILDTKAQAAPVRGGTFASVPQAACTIQPQAPLYHADGTDDAGSLAFDGTRLYYTRRSEEGPDPYAAVVRVADPAGCKDAGRLVVHFDPRVYQDARRRAVSDVDGHPPLLPERPSIDSLGYDPVHDELWFSLTRMAPFVAPYSGSPTGSPFPVWAVPRGGSGVDRQAELRFWDNPCANNGGIGLLAPDRISDTLWTCDGKVPGERTRAGKSKTTCLHPLFLGKNADGGDVWDVRAWGLGRPGTLIAVKDDSNRLPPRAVEQYDARTCTHLDQWTLAPTDNVPEPRQGPTYVSSQLVCDPVTFREALAGAPAPGAVAWMRKGPQFLVYKVTPDAGPGLTCPWPTALAYTGPAGVQPGHRLDACVTVAVPGSGGGIPRVPVRLSVAGLPARSVVSDGRGQACLPYDVPAATAAGSHLAVSANVAEDAHLLASSVVGSVLIGQPPAPPAPPIPLRPPPVPPLIVVPFAPAPAPAPAPQASVQPAASPPGQAVSQQGLASEKEREVQLAHAQQESSGEEAATAEVNAEPASDEDTSHAFVAVFAGAMGLGAMAVGRAFGGARSYAPAWSTAVADDGRKRRRRTRGRWA